MTTAKPADDTTGLPDWVRVGAKVAEYQLTSFGHSAIVTIATVEKLTNTQIVLDTPRRYRRDTLRKVGDHHGAELLPPNDSRVLATLARDEVSTLQRDLDRLLRVSRPSVEEAFKTVEDVARRVEDAGLRLARLRAAAKGGAQ